MSLCMSLCTYECGFCKIIYRLYETPIRCCCCLPPCVSSGSLQVTQPVMSCLFNAGLLHSNQMTNVLATICSTGCVFVCVSQRPCACTRGGSDGRCMTHFHCPRMYRHDVTTKSSLSVVGLVCHTFS